MQAIPSAAGTRTANQIERLMWAGLVLVPATLVFTVRIVLEQTLVTWSRPDYMMIFHMARSAFDVLGLIMVCLGVCWSLTVAAVSLVHKCRLAPSAHGLIAMTLLCVALWVVPYEQWQLLLVRIHGAGNAPRNWILRAATLGETRLLGYLIDNGVDVDTRTRSGQSALGAAAAAGRTDAARLLIARGAPLESRTSVMQTPLLEAAQWNHGDVVSLLIDHGADTSARDILGFDALDYARHNRNARMAELLERKRAVVTPTESGLP